MRPVLGALGLVVLLGAGCSLFTDLGGTTGEDDPSVLPPGAGQDGGIATTGDDAGKGQSSTGAFTIEVSPTRVYLDPGQQNVPVHLELRRRTDFTAPVTLAWNGLPSTVTTSALTLAGPTTSGDVALGAAANAPASSSAVKVLAVAGTDSAEVSIELVVTGPIATLDADGTVVLPTPAPPEVGFALWGGGGGGGGMNKTSPDYAGGSGGGGGFAGGRVAAKSGDTFVVKVGQGGKVTNQSGATGGGYTAVLRGGVTLLLAGGGGGGGAGYGQTNLASGTAGGAGGGSQGKNGGGGRAATATAGGAADTCTKAACDGIAPTPGTMLQGGNGGYPSSGAPGIVMGALPGGGSSAANAPSGGGGGGGWFGGGGGGFRVVDPTYIIYMGNGGGGGSGYVDPAVTPVVAGAQLLEAGSGTQPARTTDVHYQAGTGTGGAGAVQQGPGTVGGKGRMVAFFFKP